VSLACSTLCAYSRSHVAFCSYTHTSTTTKRDAIPISHKGCDKNGGDSSCNPNKHPSECSEHHCKSDDDKKNRCDTCLPAIARDRRSRLEPPSPVPGCWDSFLPAEWSTALVPVEETNQPAQASTARILSHRSDFSMDE
jgi:hypothetical protein